MNSPKDVLVNAISNIVYNTDWLNSLVAMLTTSPKDFFANDVVLNNMTVSFNGVYALINTIHTTMLVFGYQLLSIFFLIELTTKSIQFDSFNYKIFLKISMKFIFAKIILDNSMLLMESFFQIGAFMTQEVSAQVAMSDGLSLATDLAAIQASVDDMNMIVAVVSIPFVWILKLVLIGIKVMVTAIVFGRVLNLYVYTALAPIPLSMSVSDNLSTTTKRFLQEFASKCLNSITLLIILLLYQRIVASFYIADLEFWQGIGIYVAMNIFLVVFIKNASKLTDKIVGV